MTGQTGTSEIDIYMQNFDKNMKKMQQETGFTNSAETPSAKFESRQILTTGIKLTQNGFQT